MSAHVEGISAEEAKKKLVEGNKRSMEAQSTSIDVSSGVLTKFCKEGQQPFAIVITCADSRVIPEAIFDAEMGDIFVIRVAGNVIDKNQLGSIEYAADHLGSNLVVVLGHDHCGAVGAALGADPGGYISFITNVIKEAIGDEKDETKASCLNVQNSVKTIKESLKLNDDSKLKVAGAIYHLADGQVEFLD